MKRLDLMIWKHQRLAFAALVAIVGVMMAVVEVVR